MKTSAAERRVQLKRTLARAANESLRLNEAVELYGALVDTLMLETPFIELPELSADAVEAKLVAGNPILYKESLGFDGEAIRTLLIRLCNITEQHNKHDVGLGTIPSKPAPWPWSRPRKEPTAIEERVVAATPSDRAAAAAQIRRALASGTLDFDALLDQLVTGQDGGLAALADAAPVDPNLLTTLARFAMRPTLIACAEAYQDMVDMFAEHWMRGVCPVCGGPPVFGEYRDVDQSRHLRCAACGSSWLYRRLECAHCGSDQFRELAQIHIDDDPTCFVDTCDVCHHYIKGLNATEPISTDLLPLEDLLTIHLDAMAEKNGYAR
jgi:Protein involved in formate dehydrogenase formation